MSVMGASYMVSPRELGILGRVSAVVFRVGLREICCFPPLNQSTTSTDPCPDWPEEKWGRLKDGKDNKKENQYMYYFWHFEKVNTPRCIYNLTKINVEQVPCLSSMPLKSGVKFISRSVCLSEKGLRKAESLKNYHFPGPLMDHIIDVPEIWKMPCACHLKVTSKCTWYLLSHLLFLIVILFMSFPSLGILRRFKSDHMKHNTSGERHVLVKYGPECHHPSDVWESRGGGVKVRDESVCPAFLSNPHDNGDWIILQVQHRIIRRHLPAEGTALLGNEVYTTDTLVTST